MATEILIVEDDEKIARFLELELKHEGYEVKKSSDGREGLELALSGVFDLLLLDVMLPGLNGNEVIRRLRKVSAMPVIMLTARDAVMDKVSGLDLGADDYVTKPFAIEELLARIRSALRKKQSVKFEAEAEVLQCSGLCLDSARHTVSYNGHKIDLTKREFLMLELLMKNAGIVITRETFIDRIWGWDYVGETNIVDVYIRYLRAKIDEVFGTELISTVRGIGYVLK